ncbi:retm [Symbiodinium natans]|uniref:Retm protein n=1 Tax=Symbiodinium natans TaxID=878477 RepID=A0A812V688_9DINO|nr:retm [Symbiodinium natans]
MTDDDDGLSTYGLALLGAGAGVAAGILVKAFKIVLHVCLELVWLHLPHSLEDAGWTAEVPFGLWNLPWILGALFGLAVGTLRQSLPPSAVTTLGIWVRELHGPRGSAEPGSWLAQLVVAGLLTALSGAAVGPEPIVIIVPSVLCGFFARGLLKQPARVVRVAALAGGAGGLSAFFGLPLASAFLVLEVPHVDGAEFAMEALPACVVASITGTLAGDSIWHPASLLGNSRFGFPGSSPLHAQRPFGVGAVLFAPFAGMCGGFASHLLIACMKSLHQIFNWARSIGPWKRLQRRRIYFPLFLAGIGAVNGALGILYPSALWWGEDQLQVVLTRGCEEVADLSECVPVKLPYWYDKLQANVAVQASPGRPMSTQAMVGLGIVKMVMISLCEAELEMWAALMDAAVPCFSGWLLWFSLGVYFLDRLLGRHECTAWDGLLPSMLVCAYQQHGSHDQVRRFDRVRQVRMDAVAEMQIKVNPPQMESQIHSRARKTWKRVLQEARSKHRRSFADQKRLRCVFADLLEGLSCSSCGLVESHKGSLCAKQAILPRDFADPSVPVVPASKLENATFIVCSLCDELQASICNFLDCCAAAPRSDSSGILRHNSYAGGVDRPVWLQSDNHLHPKFCGYRLQEPGTMPCLDRFPFEELGSNVPSHWEYMLPGGCDSERAQCRELRERVRHVDGAKDAVTMLRFLRARQGRLDAAAKMYEEAMRWRRQTGYELGFRMNSRDDWLHRKVDSCWPPTAMLGKDLDGDPVYWNRMGLGSMDFLEQVPTEFLIQHEVYTITRIMQALEEASRLSNRPVMYFTVVADLGELSLRNFNIKGIMKYKVCVRTLEDNYPELVKRIIAIRVPRIAYTLWNIISKFFDEGTRDKIQIADPQNTMAVLSQFMDPKWIPEALGGTHRIGESAWCEPCIPSPQGPPSEDTMRSLQSTYGDG